MPEEEQPTTYGGVVRKARLARKWTQRQLAEKAKLDVTYLSKIENDNVDPPSEETIRKIAGFLGEDPEKHLNIARKVPVGMRQQIKDYPPEASEVVRALSERPYEARVYNRLLRTLKQERSKGAPSRTIRPR